MLFHSFEFKSYHIRNAFLDYSSNVIYILQKLNLRKFSTFSFKKVFTFFKWKFEIYNKTNNKPVIK